MVKMGLIVKGLFVILHILYGINYIDGATGVLSWTNPTDASSVEISEDIAVGTILTLNAGSPASKITYEIQSQPQSNIFTVGGTDGDELIIGSALDYETTTSYELTVKAFEKVDLDNSAIATFTISVTDANDNPPVLSASPASPISLKENTAADTVVTTISHTDEDTNAAYTGATYAITSGATEFLTLDGTELKTTSSPIDFTTDGQFIIEITGSDDDVASSLTGVISLTITITTEPIFTSPSGGGSTASIPENAVAGDLVFPFVVDDEDDLDAAVVTSFSGDDGTDNLFEISGSQLVVKSGAVFDFETTTSYTITFQATDTVYTVTSDTLTISVTDVNEAPVFNPNSKSYVFKSGDPSGTSIDDLSTYVTDPESDTLTYSLSGTSLLVIDENSGAVVTDGVITYDPDASTITATVTATDTDEETGTITITVNVKTAPVFSSDNTVDLAEDATNPDVVIGLTSTDADGDTNPVYTINTAETPFEISGTNVIVESGASFDYDDGDREYVLSLTVTDVDGYTDSMTLTVSITNINDKAPVFTSSSSDLDIWEGISTDDIVHTVTATDDSENAIVYSITSGNTAGHFTIDPNTGVVTATQALSFASTASYTLEFTADDSEQSSTMSVTFNLRTIPTMEDATEQLDENSDPGTVVHTFIPVDGDGDTEFTYTILSQSPEDAFTINDGNTAVITLPTAAFDFEVGPTTYTLSLRIQDDFPLSSDSTLTVNINNLNDETPQFQDASYAVSVKENQGALSSILQVAVTDADNGDTIAFTLSDDTLIGISSTGVLSTVTSLVFSDTPTISITITATDAAGHSATVSLVVTVIEETDVIFVNPSPDSGATVLIAENEPSGTSLYVLRSTDADGDTPTYEATTNSDKVDIDTDNLQVSTATSLDYETETSFEVTFTVTDQNAVPHVSTATLTVSITDVNDNAPTFSSDEYTATILEESDTDVTTVTATDIDSSLDNNNVIQYSISAGNDLDIFTINPSTGVIEADGTLTDFTTFQSHTLTITAKDLNGAEGALSSTTSVVVSIRTAPYFTDPEVEGKTYNIGENVAENGLVAQLSAEDEDTIGVLVYSIDNQDPSSPTNLVVFDEETPGRLIRGSTTFDREAVSPLPDNIMLLVTVFDGTYGSSNNIVIAIDDENDKTPEFERSEYMYQVLETDGVEGFIVGTVLATDDDVSAGSPLTYSITGSSQFTMSSTVNGQIEVASSLTASSSPLSMTLNAFDGANTGTASLSITVYSEPVWSVPSAANAPFGIDEDASSEQSVVTLLATDTDSAPSSLAYSIVSQTPTSPANVFVLDTDNPGLIVRGSVDLNYDGESAIRSFTLVVRVTDGEYPRESSVVININDVNDITPAFTETTYSFDVHEDASPDDPVGTVQATDDDESTEFNTISYSITAGEGASDFTMNSATGEITVVGSLVGVSTPYSLTVTASDGELSDTATVNIAVSTDPVWDTPLAPGTSVDIDEEVTGLVYTLLATDADNDELTYSILSITPNTPAEAFVLVENTGQINVGTTLLDVDLADTISTSYTVAVRVTDGTTNVDSNIVINLADLNDNDPEFDSASYTFNINDQVSIGTSVGTVLASDDDLTLANNEITYTLSGTNADHFVMDPVTNGQINTAVSMVNAPTPYSLTVTASDSGSSPDTAPVTINVKTVPQWTQPPTNLFEVDTDENGNSDIFLLQSSDADGDTPVYTIVSQTPDTPAGLFVLSSSTNGQIDVGSTVLDYDSSDISSSYTLELRLSDGTTSVDRNLVINIVDLNDEVPNFSESSYSFPVIESASVGTSVGTVAATDDDVNSDFNTIGYSLTGTGASDFEVTNTGQINTAGTLNFDAASSYSLTLTASDSVNNGDTLILITVNAAPTWNDLPASVTVAENIDSSNVFFQLSATDKNSDSLTYSIKSQTVTNFFVLGGSEDVDVIMSADKVLDYEANQQHTLTFEVTDGTNTPVVSSELEITVTDQNDNNPVFAASTINLYVKDTAAVGSTVTTLTATDADSSLNDNNVLTYEILSGNTNGFFALNSQVLTLALSYSTGNSETIVVRATDGGTGPRTGDVTLIITGTAPSNPVLTAPLQSSGALVSLSESVSIGTLVYSIEASDSDGDTLIYSIVSPSPPPDEFHLVGNELQVKLALDYEETTSYQIVFEVDDHDGDASNKLTSGTLTVIILNENDNFPTFNLEFITVEVMEKQTEAVKVIELTATDRDIGQAGDLTYSIVSGDYFSQFKMIGNTLYTTNLGLNRDVQKHHLIAVQAKDGGTPARADSVHVKVVVTPLSDESGAMATEWNIVVFITTLMCTLWKLVCSYI